MAPGNRQRASLQTGLDKDVYQIVKKFQDDQPEGSPVPSVPAVYRYIQSSNSSVKRKPKQIVQNSIERVLSVLSDDENDQESEGPDSMELELDALKQPERGMNFMNKSITGAWASNTPSGTNTPAPESKRKDIALRQTNGEPMKKKRKADTFVDRSPPTSIRLEDIGGVENVMETLEKHLILPLLMPEEYVERHASIPRGILLHGPPGCGKTVISKAFAAEVGVPFIEIQGPSIVSGMSGESEQKVRELFEEARRLAPALIFIDEIDVIAPKRDTSQSQMEKRIVAQLLISMDSLALEQNDGKPVIVLAATNRPDSIDPALRRGGRFGTEINMGVPNEKMREQILQALTRQSPLAEDVNFGLLANRTPGFVGADLRDLLDKATEWSMDKYRAALVEQAISMESNGDAGDMEVDPAYAPHIRRIKQLIKRARRKDLEKPAGFESGKLTMEAFLSVLPDIQPSSKREGFATIPDTTWNDIGALEDIREALEMAVIQPIQNPQRYKKVGISGPTGVLLFGPPGCGKTLLAKAVARESKANFISVKGPELLNKYVGESERAIRQVFIRARSSIPCVLFFDELDALVPHRDNSLSEAGSRVVNTLLTELDGLGGSREGIYMIAATNRPDTIDAAILRPGRLETLLYVGLPGPSERAEILTALLRKTPINPELAQCSTAPSCDGFSGADLQSLVRLAAQTAIKQERDVVTAEDFMVAISKIRRSVTDADVQRYEKLAQKFQSKI